MKSSKPAESSLVITCIEGEEEEETSLEDVVKTEKFSSVTKMIRITALVLLLLGKLWRARSRKRIEEHL